MDVSLQKDVELDASLLKVQLLVNQKKQNKNLDLRHLALVTRRVSDDLYRMILTEIGGKNENV